MMKPLYLKGCYFLIFLLSCSFHGQKKEIFNFDIPQAKVQQSYYKKIKLIDAREDSLSLGVFQGKLHVLETPLETQLQKILDGLNPGDAGEGELVLYLKRLRFTDNNAGSYIHFQGYLFSKNPEGEYSSLGKADEIVLQSFFGSKKENYKRVNEVVVNFIEKSISQKPKFKNKYTFQNLKNFIDLDKQNYALYNGELKDGIYDNYYRFKTQTPSDIVITDVNFAANPDKIYKVYYMETGKKKSLDIKKTFAIVYKNQPYILVPDDNNYTKTVKKEGEFYFTGNIKGNSGGAYMLFGLTGALLYVILDPKTKYEFMLDYFNGNSVPVRKIERY